MHGGERFRSAVRLDAEVLSALRELTDLAPLHQPKSLAAVEAVSRALPDVPEVAASTPPSTPPFRRPRPPTPLPREWRERYRVRRFGFHGLSHAYAAGRARELAPDARRVVTCHLGAGASLCAVLDGRSIDTTMGFTPLEGLVMATRSGSVDPGLLLWLQEQAGLTPQRDGRRARARVGARGLAGTPDMRELLGRDDADARLALDVYLHRLRAGIGAMAAALDGLDALVFTGGVGEGSARVRELACEGLRTSASSSTAAQRGGARRRRRSRRGLLRRRARHPRPRGPRDRPAGADAARLGDCGKLRTGERGLLGCRGRATEDGD